MNNQNSQWIKKTRNAAGLLQQGLDELRAAAREYEARDLGNSLDNGTRVSTDEVPVQLGDFEGANAAVTKDAMINMMVFLENFETMLAAGNAAHLYNAK